MQRVVLPKIQDTGDDFVDSLQLRTDFSTTTNHYQRVSRPENKARNQVTVKRWKRVKEVERAGIGNVWLEQEEAVGSLRVVRQVSKSRHKLRLVEYLKETLALGKFIKDDSLFVQLLGWYQSPEAVYIATENVPDGDLQHCVYNCIPENEVQSIASQIVEALSIMHEKNIAHRDLRPATVFVFDRPRQTSLLHDNVLPEIYPNPPVRKNALADDPSQSIKFQNTSTSPVETKQPSENKSVVQSSSTWWVKLGDFGISQRVCEEIVVSQLSIGSDFTAPEIIGFIEDDRREASDYMTAMDMWSLGCLIYWLLTGRVPLTRWRLNLYCRNMLAFPTQYLQHNKVSESGIEFIQRLLMSQPCDRLSASDALKHRWLQDLYQDNETSNSSLFELESASDGHGKSESLPKNGDQVPDEFSTGLHKDTTYGKTLPAGVDLTESQSPNHQNTSGIISDILDSNSSDDSYDSDDHDTIAQKIEATNTSGVLHSQETSNKPGKPPQANPVKSNSKTHKPAVKIIDTYQNQKSIFDRNSTRFLFGCDSSSENPDSSSHVSLDVQDGSSQSRSHIASHRRYSTGSRPTRPTPHPSTPPLKFTTPHVEELSSIDEVAQEDPTLYETLYRLEIELDGIWRPACTMFLRKPPREVSKFDKEHKRLSEGIDQFILKLDAIGLSGYNGYRSWKKKMIKSAQRQLRRLESAAM